MKAAISEVEVEKTVKVKERVITLELSESEAKDLAAILGAIGGTFPAANTLSNFYGHIYGKFCLQNWIGRKECKELRRGMEQVRDFYYD